MHSGNRYHAAKKLAGDPYATVFQTFGDVIERYSVHLESKSCDPSGQTCGPLSRGLLQRRSVIARSTGVHVGKEANQVEKVEWGIIHNMKEVQAVFIDPERDPIRTSLLPALRTISLKTIAERIGRSQRQARSYRNGHVIPPAELVPSLWDLVREKTATITSSP